MSSSDASGNESEDHDSTSHYTSTDESSGASDASSGEIFPRVDAALHCRLRDAADIVKSRGLLHTANVKGHSDDDGEAVQEAMETLLACLGSVVYELNPRVAAEVYTSGVVPYLWEGVLQRSRASKTEAEAQADTLLQTAVALLCHLARDYNVAYATAETISAAAPLDTLAHHPRAQIRRLAAQMLRPLIGENSGRAAQALVRQGLVPALVTCVENELRSGAGRHSAEAADDAIWSLGNVLHNKDLTLAPGAVRDALTRLVALAADGAVDAQARCRVLQTAAFCVREDREWRTPAEKAEAQARLQEALDSGAAVRAFALIRVGLDDSLASAALMVVEMFGFRYDAAQLRQVSEAGVIGMMWAVARGWGAEGAPHASHSAAAKLQRMMHHHHHSAAGAARPTPCDLYLYPPLLATLREGGWQPAAGTQKEKNDLLRIVLKTALSSAVFTPAQRWELCAPLAEAAAALALPSRLAAHRARGLTAALRKIYGRLPRLEAPTEGVVREALPPLRRLAASTHKDVSRDAWVCLRALFAGAGADNCFPAPLAEELQRQSPEASPAIGK